MWKQSRCKSLYLDGATFITRASGFSFKKMNRSGTFPCQALWRGFPAILLLLLDHNALFPSIHEIFNSFLWIRLYIFEDVNGPEVVHGFSGQNRFGKELRFSSNEWMNDTKSVISGWQSWNLRTFRKRYLKIERIQSLVFDSLHETRWLLKKKQTARVFLCYIAQVFVERAFQMVKDSKNCVWQGGRQSDRSRASVTNRIWTGDKL